MAFSCGIVLTDIDTICNKNSGGLKRVILYKQNDVQIITDPFDESIILSIEAVNPNVIQFNRKDGVTSFNESKSKVGNLGIITTTITVQLPNINEALNKIDMLGVRDDIVAVCWHNNDTVTVTGVMDGMDMIYETSSGAGVSEKSYINVILNCESAIGSVVVNDTSYFVDKTIFE